MALFPFSGIPLSEKFWRGLHTDIFKCIYCNSDKVDIRTTPVASTLGMKAPNETYCGSCGERLRYLESRDYGLSYHQIIKNHERHGPWKDEKTPLWAINKKGLNHDG